MPRMVRQPLTPCQIYYDRATQQACNSRLTLSPYTVRLATMNPMPYEIVLGDFAQQWVLGRHLEQKVTGLRARSSR